MWVCMGEVHLCDSWIHLCLRKVGTMELGCGINRNVGVGLLGEFEAVLTHWMYR